MVPAGVTARSDGVHVRMIPRYNGTTDSHSPPLLPPRGVLQQQQQQSAVQHRNNQITAAVESGVPCIHYPCCTYPLI